MDLMSHIPPCMRMDVLHVLHFSSAVCTMYDGKHRGEVFLLMATVRGPPALRAAGPPLKPGARSVTSYTLPGSSYAVAFLHG